jgi:AraC-like DNA-binding protein
MGAMRSPAPHRSRVLASPWAGVYATETESARHYGRHWHSSYGFGLIDDGAHRSGSSRGAVDAYAGDIVCANPGEVHDGRPLGGPSRRWRTVYVEPQVLASIAALPGSHGPCEAAFAAPAFSDPLLRRALLRLLQRLDAWTRAGAAGRADEALACEEALALACGRMLRDHSTAAAPPDEPGDLARVRERLADARLPAPTLAELGALAGLGKFQLLRRFRRAYGATPHDWLVQLRADRARGLIRQGLGLPEAAACAGFADQSHMTRVFVRRFGFTPGAWQRAVAA